ncbi:free fatty acid receptor 3-like [Pelecanus crispus]|uniref:free fatty acid receptor 3-like n=1 Tax=Pelecanus crispus TaxID=36300 RepID=UPI003F5D1E26
MLILTIYILTFAVGFPANVFTFVTLLSKARRRVSSSDILLLNLTAADLLLLLFLPFKMVEAAASMTWPLPTVLCPVANFCFYSSIYISSLFLAALSVERYLSVVFPHQYKNRKRPGQAMAASVVLWLVACSHCSIVFVAEYHGARNPQPAANGSTALAGSHGSTLSGFAAGGSQMSDGFEPNGLTMANPDGFISSGSSGSNPSGSSGSNPRGSSISSGFSGSNPSGSRISSGSSVSSISSVSSVSNPSISSISSVSNPSGSNPFTPNGADTPAVASPTNGSQAPKTYKCYDDFSKDQLSFVLPLRLELFLVLFLLPFTITVFCYVNFVRALLARPNIPLRKKQRAVGLAVATMVNFGVCFMPYNVSHVVGFVRKQSPPWRVYALLLTSLNAALDPVVFYFSSTAVQRAMAGVVVAAWGKLGGAVGWCYGACSSEASQDESDGSFT